MTEKGSERAAERKAVMIEKILPGRRNGTVSVPSSKSQAHRILMAAALSSEPVRILCRGISDDIAATMACLEGLGATFDICGDEIRVTRPVTASARERNADTESRALLPCGESGSTLRFLLPLAGALGRSGELTMKGRLPYRPMQEYEEVLVSHGMTIRRDGEKLYCEGQLKAGEYILPGNISSQYFTGLLMALPLLAGDSILKWEGRLESADYVNMTEEVLDRFKIRREKLEDGYRIFGSQRYTLSCCAGIETGQIRVEGDYSSAAFFLCMGAFSKQGITVSNLSAASRQGDRRVLEILKSFGAEVEQPSSDSTAVRVRNGDLQGIRIDASMIPDLVPALSIVAAAAKGSTRIFHAERLRMKESDRIRSTCRMLQALGAEVQETEDGMIIRGIGTLEGGAEVDSCQDHRIAMAAAAGACICRNPVTIRGAECVSKSYPQFWEDYHKLESETE